MNNQEFSGKVALVTGGTIKLRRSLRSGELAPRRRSRQRFSISLPTPPDSLPACHCSSMEAVSQHKN
jgi:hypothetical protein